MSTSSPWDSEYRLDEQTVRELLAEQFPGLPVASIAYVHQGCDNVVYLVNGEWVFRFPKRAERQEWIDSELAALDLLRRPLALRVPSPEFVGAPSRRFPCGFMGYRLLPGRPGHRVDRRQVDRQASARLLGGFFTALHAVDAREAAARGVKSYDWPLAEALTEVVSFRDVLLAKLPPELASACNPLLAGRRPPPDESGVRRCLVHGDIADEHVLLDDAGCVCGIIDWGDAGLSDPANDFGGLYTWLGAEFVLDVLAHYGHSWDAQFLEQIAFRARCVALIGYGWSLTGFDGGGTDPLKMVYTAFGVPTAE